MPRLKFTRVMASKEECLAAIQVAMHVTILRWYDIVPDVRGTEVVPKQTVVLQYITTDGIWTEERSCSLHSAVDLSNTLWAELEDAKKHDKLKNFTGGDFSIHLPKQQRSPRGF